MVHVTESSTTPWRLLSKEILHDVNKYTKDGLREAGELVPGFIQQTFDAEGARGGKKIWERVIWRYLRIRKTYPKSGSMQEKYTYVLQHKPLIDTGKLYNSFKTGNVFTEGGVMAIETTSKTKYGYGHDTGTGRTPIGSPVWKRPFMFIVADEDTKQIDKAFEGVWSE